MSRYKITDWIYEHGLETPGHVGSIKIFQGWGEPAEYQAYCSCGWRGITYTACNSTILAPPHRDFLNKWGEEQYALISGNVFHKNASHKVVLSLIHHLQYPWVTELMKTQKLIEAKHEELLYMLSREDLAYLMEKGGYTMDVERAYEELHELALKVMVLNEIPVLIESVTVAEEQGSIVKLEAYKEYKKLLTLGGEK